MGPWQQKIGAILDGKTFECTSGHCCPPAEDAAKGSTIESHQAHKNKGCGKVYVKRATWVDDYELLRCCLLASFLKNKTKKVAITTQPRAQAASLLQAAEIFCLACHNRHRFRVVSHPFCLSLHYYYYMYGREQRGAGRRDLLLVILVHKISGFHTRPKGSP